MRIQIEQMSQREKKCLEILKFVSKNIDQATRAVRWPASRASRRAASSNPGGGLQCARWSAAAPGAWSPNQVRVSRRVRAHEPTQYKHAKNTISIRHNCVTHLH